MDRRLEAALRVYRESSSQEDAIEIAKLLARKGYQDYIPEIRIRDLGKNRLILSRNYHDAAYINGLPRGVVGETGEILDYIAAAPGSRVAFLAPEKTIEPDQGEIREHASDNWQNKLDYLLNYFVQSGDIHAATFIAEIYLFMQTGINELVLFNRVNPNTGDTNTSNKRYHEYVDSLHRVLFAHGIPVAAINAPFNQCFVYNSGYVTANQAINAWLRYWSGDADFKHQNCAVVAPQILYGLVS